MITESSHDLMRSRYLSNDTANINIGDRALNGAAVTIVFQIARIFIQILSLATFARLLMPGDFGLAAMAGTVTVFLSVFTDFGLNSATVQRPNISQNFVSSLFVLNIGIGAALWGIACALAPLAAWLYGDDRLLGLIVLMSLAIPLAAIGAQHQALLARAMQWYRVNTVSIAGQFGGFVIATLSVVAFSVGFWALAIQQVAAAFISTVLSWILCAWRPSRSIDIREASSGIAFGGYLTGFNFLNYFHREADNVLIGWYWGSVELGFYNRAYALLTLPLLFINRAATSVAVPVLSRLNEEREKWNLAYLKMTTAVTWVGVGICVVIFSSAEPIILIILGDSWSPVVEIFRNLSISSVIAVTVNTCGWVFISNGQTRSLMLWALFATPCFVVSYFVGLSWGGSGVALAYAVTMLFVAPAYVWFALRRTTINFFTYWSWVGYIHILGMLSGVGGFLVDKSLNNYSLIYRLVVASAVSGMTYLISTAALAVISSRHRELFLRVISWGVSKISLHVGLTRGEGARMG